MHEKIFADSIRPAVAQILGLPLAPYSLGHDLLLLASQNALVSLPEKDFQILEFWKQIFSIRQAVWFCSDAFHARDRIDRETFPFLRSRWDNLKRRLWVRRLKSLGPDDYSLAILEFRNYLWSSRPSMPGPDKRSADVCAEAGGYTTLSQMTGRGFGAPLVARLLSFAINLRLDERVGLKRPQTVFDLPYGLVLNLYQTQLENDGRMWIENQEEQEEKIDYAKKVKEFAAKEKAAPVADPGLVTPIPDELKT